MFHISHLKLAIGSYPSSQFLPPQLKEDLSWQAEPEELLGVRFQGGTADSHKEVLIKWRDLPLSEATWENMSTIATLFPGFHLEDKVAFWGWGIAKPPLQFTYSRKGRKGNNQ